MDQELKKALQDAFEAPAPKRKEAFLRSVPQPGISNLSFMISQAGYIRKRVWGISGVLFGVAYLGACVLGQDVMWVISALLPFAAVSVVSEHHRSYVFQMSELEMAARFSLKSVALARIGILGISHLLLLLFLIPAEFVASGTVEMVGMVLRTLLMLFLIPACAWFHTSSLFQTGLYLLVPYLLSADAGLWAVRKTQGQEAIYACVGIAVCVSGLNLLVQRLFPVLFGIEYTLGWVLLLAGAAVCAVKEWKWNVNRLSELVCA